VARKDATLSMTSKGAQRLRWKRIERWVEDKKRDVRVGDLAHRFKLAPSIVSRGLKRRGIVLTPSSLPWEASSNPERQERVEKRYQVLALYFLGLKRQQIEGLLPIKSETVRNYILALTIEVREPGWKPYRMFNDDAMGSLTKDLEKCYGLGEHMTEVLDTIHMAPIGHYSTNATHFFRQFSGIRPSSTAFLMRKLRQILRTTVSRRGRFILIKGRNNCLIKL
jgi:hypothetical protein